MLYDYNEDEFVDVADILYTIPLDKLFKLNNLSFILLENEEEENDSETE